jgi:uncharacterized protein DUF2460
MTSFHEVLFPLDIALKSAGGPQRRTDVVTLGSGAEERRAINSFSEQFQLTTQGHATRQRGFPINGSFWPTICASLTIADSMTVASTLDGRCPPDILSMLTAAAPRGR